MSFRYVVVCDADGCYRQQGIITDKVRHDGTGVLVEDLKNIGWIEDEEGYHLCPFCNPEFNPDLH